MVIKDTLDENVEFVSASDNGAEADGIVTWTLKEVPANTEGTVTVTVKVLEGAKESNGGAGKVVNGGDTTTVQVGNDTEYSVESVENPVPEEPHKKEVTPYEGTGELGGVKVGEEITYEISYKNYKAEAADVVIRDMLDEHVEFVEASDDGIYDAESHEVTWTFEDMEAGKEDRVTLTIRVLEGALKSEGGPDKVVNGGEPATDQVGNDHAYELEVVENPVAEKEEPAKTEKVPYEGTGVLGGVKVGDRITYEISYRNYKSMAADVLIADKLDDNVKFVKASDGGKENAAAHTVEWKLEQVQPCSDGKVTLTVEVLPGALKSQKGPAKVVNGGETATVKVGNDDAVTLNTVENPVPEEPEKKEVSPYEGTGLMGGVEVGDEITYEIRFMNYKADPADITVRDSLDKNVRFVSADQGGTYDKASNTVTWTLERVDAGAEGTVRLTVAVLEGAKKSAGGSGQVVNGGESATVQVGNDQAFELTEVINPVPEVPHKKEIAPYEGNGTLGKVRCGDEIAYEISFRNYKEEAADVTVKDQLDEHVSFVSASDGGAYDASTHTVTWTIKAVKAGAEGSVKLVVKVLESALASAGGPDKVVNGGDTATVQVGNDKAFTLEKVENPVAEHEEPEKVETAPYSGSGELGEVKAGEEITYEISYRNYKSEAADITITDTLDEHVELISASDHGVLKNGVVTWVLKDVPVGREGTVSLTVKVLESACVVNEGPGFVVNGGDSTTVQVGNDEAVTVSEVTNPVPDPEPEPEPEEKTYEGQIRKINAKTMRDLKGATLEVQDEDGNVAATWKSDGKVWTVEGLKAGVTYTIVETVVPNLFTEQPNGDLADGEVQFRIKEDGTVVKVSHTGLLEDSGIVDVANAPNGFNWDEWEENPNRTSPDEPEDENTPTKKPSTDKDDSGSEKTPTSSTRTTTTTTSSGGNITTTRTTSSPQTGDTSPIIPYAAALLAAALVIALILRKKRRGGK